MARMNGKKGNIGRELLFIEVEEDGVPDVLNPSVRSSSSPSSNITPVHTNSNSKVSSVVDQDSNSQVSKELAQSIVSDKQERLLGKGQLPSITK